jgi:hypothetical protein
LLVQAMASFGASPSGSPTLLAAVAQTPQAVIASSAHH